MTANLTDLSSMPARQRATYYHQQAGKLRLLAEAQSDEKIRARLFGLADQYQTLAMSLSQNRHDVLE
jgi:hypothetical protein